MAVIANTFTTAAATNNREELSDVVSRITPQDTPIYSLIGKTSCDSVHPEWSVDELDAPAENVIPEGEEYTFGPTRPVDRLGDYTQIMRKDGIVSMTQEAVDNAGNVEKVKKQKLKKGIELRKDVEFAIVANQPSVNGQVRRLGGLPTWIETNVSRGAGGANGGFNDATGLTEAATAGTKRAFTKTIMDSIAQQGYEAGANFAHMVGSPYVKSVFVGFMESPGVAEFRYAAQSRSKNVLVATADIYEGPYGRLMIHPNRVMTTATNSGNVFFLDPEMVKFAWLRKIKEDKNLANTGDSKKFVLIGEGTLCVKNEQGLGVAADIFGLTAAS